MSLLGQQLKALEESLATYDYPNTFATLLLMCSMLGLEVDPTKPIPYENVELPDVRTRVQRARICFDAADLTEMREYLGMAMGCFLH